MEPKRSPRIEGYHITSEDLDMLVKALGGLSVRDCNVIAARFGLEGKPPQTYKQVSEECGISLERARQIVEKAKRRLNNLKKKQQVPTLVITLQGQQIKEFHEILKVAKADMMPIMPNSVSELLDKLYRASDVDIYNPVMIEEGTNE